MSDEYSNDIEAGQVNLPPRATINRAREKLFALKRCTVALWALSLFLYCAVFNFNGCSTQVAKLHRQLRAPFYVGVADTITVDEREAEINAKFDIVVKYQDVKTLNYYSMVKPYLDKGKKVAMVIEFKSDSYRNLKSIGDGDYDSYLHKFIDDMKKDGNREVFIRPLHEFNGDWYPWGTYRGGENSTSNFKRAFRHVAEVFKGRDANVKIQLDYNCKNPRGDKKFFKDWFPGEDVVDMIMCNVYNRSGVDQWHKTWDSFSDVFLEGYTRMESLPGNKALGVGEVSSTNNGGDKAQWLRDSFSALIYKFTRVQEADFFLINKGHTNWDLNSDAERRAFGESVNKYKWASYTKKSDEAEVENTQS